MDTGIIPLVKQVVIIFTIVITVFILLSFGYAKLKALITGKKPPKTGPELYAAQLAMQKNPNQPQVKKARIPSKEKEAPKQKEEPQPVENVERLKAPNPPLRRNDEARRSRAQSRVNMNIVQQSIPKRNVFQVVNNQQANFRGISTGTISYTPTEKPSTTQATMRNQSLFTTAGQNPQTQRTPPGKVNINFK